MKLIVQKVLVVYSAIVSTALLAVVVLGAQHPHTTAFDQIRVHRIDVVEPDGTLRMDLSNKDRLPPVIIKGEPRPEMGEPRPQAGMLFYNDEGTENGGLIFSGSKNAKGEVVDSGGSLSFDRYDAGQIIQLAGVEDKTDHFAGLNISDGKRRVWIGHDEHGTGLSMNGPDGKKRIDLMVAQDGTPSLVFYDAQGHILQVLQPEKKSAK